MTRTIAFLYDHHEDAVQTVRDLEAHLPRDEISIVAAADRVAEQFEPSAERGQRREIRVALAAGLPGLAREARQGFGPLRGADHRYDRSHTGNQHGQCRASTANRDSTHARAIESIHSVPPINSNHAGMLDTVQ